MMKWVGCCHSMKFTLCCVSCCAMVIVHCFVWHSSQVQFPVSRMYPLSINESFVFVLLLHVSIYGQTLHHYQTSQFIPKFTFRSLSHPIAIKDVYHKDRTLS